MFRVLALSLLTFVALGLSWQLASVASPALRASPPIARAEGAARGLTPAARSAGGTDQNSVRSTATGSMVVFALGLPLVVVDGGTSIPLRVPRGATVAEALDLAGIALGPLDRVSVSTRQDATVASGDVVRVVRVTETQAVLREPVAFAVKTVADPTLPVGRSVVATAGVPGTNENTYRVRLLDGVEGERELIATVAVTAPVAEVRNVGTRPAAPPPASGAMQTIITAAAATWGADPTQLLRVAYCESKYNPNAYNASSGASGLFQFLASTWRANSVRAGYAGASVFDPVANANTAAYMFANGQARQWSCK